MFNCFVSFFVWSPFGLCCNTCKDLTFSAEGVRCVSAMILCGCSFCFCIFRFGIFVPLGFSSALAFRACAVNTDSVLWTWVLWEQQRQHIRCNHGKQRVRGMQEGVARSGQGSILREYVRRVTMIMLTVLAFLLVEWAFEYYRCTRNTLIVVVPLLLLFHAFLRDLMLPFPAYLALKQKCTQKADPTYVPLLHSKNCIIKLHPWSYELKTRKPAVNGMEISAGIVRWGTEETVCQRRDNYVLMSGWDGISGRTVGWK